MLRRFLRRQVLPFLEQSRARFLGSDADADDPFVDDARFFSPRKLAERRRWRGLLRDTGEADLLASLENVHAGRRAFIVGNGPSIKKQDLSLLSGEISFVTNWFANHEDYDRIRPTYYCISSHEVFGGWEAEAPRLNADMHRAITGKEWRSHHFFPLWARDGLLEDPAFSRDKLNFLVFEKPKATVSERGTMNWDVRGNLDDGFTGIVTFCLPLALHMGIREIYLLGCDCDYQIQSAQDPKAYFYDFSKHTTSTSRFETLDRIWGPGGEIFRVYEIVRREAEERGLVIRNATEGGLLEVFERARFEDLFR